jgi:hypothetical protein
MAISVADAVIIVMPEEETPIAEYRVTAVAAYCRYELFPTTIRVRGGVRTGNQYDITVVLANLQPKFNVHRYPSPLVKAGTILLGMLMFVFILLVFALKRPWLSTEMIACEALIGMTFLLMIMNWGYRNCYSFVYHSGVPGLTVFQHGRDSKSCEDFARKILQQIEAQSPAKVGS